jgi:hypothetical protein
VGADCLERVRRFVPARDAGDDSTAVPYRSCLRVTLASADLDHVHAQVCSRWPDGSDDGRGNRSVQTARSLRGLGEGLRSRTDLRFRRPNQVLTFSWRRIPAERWRPAVRRRRPAPRHGQTPVRPTRPPRDDQPPRRSTPSTSRPCPRTRASAAAVTLSDCARGRTRLTHAALRQGFGHLKPGQRNSVFEPLHGVSFAIGTALWSVCARRMASSRHIYRSASALRQALGTTTSYKGGWGWRLMSSVIRSPTPSMLV